MFAPQTSASGAAGAPALPPGVCQLPYPPSDCISRLRFSSFTTGSTYMLGACSWDKTCRVWQVVPSPQAGMNVQPIAMTEHTAPILDMSFSGDDRVFFGGCCKTAMVWHASSSEKRQVAEHDLPVSCLSYVNSRVAQEMLITGSWDGKVKFWDLRQPRPVKEEDYGEPIFAMDAQRTSPFAAFAVGRAVYIYDLSTMQRFKSLPPPEAVRFNFRCVACHPKCEGVAVSTSEGRVFYQGLSDSSTVCVFKGHHKEVIGEGPNYSKLALFQSNFCAYHPNGSTCFSGGGDGRIAVFNLKLKRHITHIECHQLFKKRSVPISAGDISPDGNYIAYAHSYDWSLGKGGCDKELVPSVFVRPVVQDWLR